MFAPAELNEETGKTTVANEAVEESHYVVAARERYADGSLGRWWRGAIALVDILAAADRTAPEAWHPGTRPGGAAAPPQGDVSLIRNTR
jgi:hypothetical protein